MIHTITNRIMNFKRTHFIDFDISGDSTILISGMGRSGTTWLSEIINHDNKYRDIFEPFNPNKVPYAKEFKYIQYLNNENKDLKLSNTAKSILSGKIRSNWTDVNIN